MTYYTKGEDGEYSEVAVDDMFKDRHDRWVKTESTKIREEVEKTVRDELTPTITTEIEEKIKSEYEPKLQEVTDKAAQLETTLRQKTIAAEYGFKPGTEKYLGNGSEDEMRKEADTLKNSFANGITPPEKTTGTGESTTQKRTGIKVTV